MLGGEMNLEHIAAHVEKNRVNPKPRSGQQEYLESIINTYL
jgi:xylose isomerase